MVRMRRIRATFRQMRRQARMSQAYAANALRNKYWLMESPQVKEFCETKSTIKAILTKPGRKSAIIICRDGEVMLMSHFSTDINRMPRTHWTGRVVLITGETEMPKILHAAYDWFLDAVFFTAESFSGISYALLSNIEADSRNNRVTLLQPMAPWNENQGVLDQHEYFQGLATDSENNLLFVCKKECITVWSTADLANPRRLEVITLPGDFTPEKIALYLDDFSSTRALLTISDRGNAGLVQMQLIYEHSALSVGPATRVLPQDDAKSTLKLANDKPALDMHYDKLGNLFIAAGECRIQIIPCVRTLESFRDRPKNDEEEYFENTTWANLGRHMIDVVMQLGSGVDATAVVKTANGRRIILAGVEVVPDDLSDRLRLKRIYRVMGISAGTADRH